MAIGAAIIAQFGGDVTGIRGSAQAAEAVVSGFSSNVTKVMSALGVTLSVGAVVGFFKTIIDRAGALQDLSDQLGVSTDALQAFDYRVRMSGATTEQANGMWERAKKSLDSLAAGGESAAEQFAAIGLSAKDFVGLSLDQALQKIAEGYAASSTHAGAYEALTDILGSRSAPKLNNVLLQLAAEGFPQFIAAAKQAGQVMDEDGIERIDELNDRYEELSGRLWTGGLEIWTFFDKVAQKFGGAAAAALNMIDLIETDFSALPKNSERTVTALSALEPALVKTTEQLKRQKELTEASAKFEDIIAKGLRDQETPAAKLAELKRQMALAAAEAVAAGDDELKMQLAMNKQAELAVEYRRTAAVEKKKEIEATRLSHDEEIEWAKLELKALRGIGLEETYRLEQLRLIRDEKQVQYKIDQLMAKGVQNLTTAEKTVLDQLFRQKETLAQQITAKQQLIDGARAQVVEEKKVTDELWRQVSITRVGTPYESQSTAALSGVAQRLRNQLAEIKSQPGYGTNPLIKMLSEGPMLAELAAVEKELSQRRAVASWIAKNDEESARRRYGDDIVDRSLRDTADASTRSAVASENLLDYLRRRLGQPSG
jgi:hypothetical protein